MIDLRPSRVPHLIKTPRLLLRPVQKTDAKMVFEGIEESRENLEKWLDWPHRIKKWEDCARDAESFYDDFMARRAFHFLILNKEEKMVGMVSLNGVNWSEKCSDIGYWGNKIQKGKGYMTEAVRALTVWGFNAVILRRLGVVTDAQNIPSRHIMRRLNFTLEEKKKGLMGKPKNDDVRVCCVYARYNTQNLVTNDIYWLWT